jgi:predicted dehydrogenase
LGAAVLCEKPIAATMDDVKSMADAAKRAGKPVSIGYQWSFSESVQAMKADIMSGRFGRPIRLKTLVLWPRNQKYYDRSPWAGKIRTANGEWVLDSPVNNATAHYLHNMLYVLGDRVDGSAEPVSVEAELYRANAVENYDTAALRIRLRNGAEALFYSTHAVPETIGPVACYEFEKATICYQGRAGNVFQARTCSGETVVYGNPEAGGGKLWNTVEAVRAGVSSTLCGIEAAGMHTCCIEAAQQTTIHQFSPDAIKTKTDEDSSFTYAVGLDAVFVQCYNMNLLPSEFGTIPWSRPAAEIACCPMTGPLSTGGGAA